VSATFTLGLGLAITVGCSSSDAVVPPFGGAGSAGGSSGTAGGGSGTSGSGVSSGAVAPPGDAGAGGGCDAYCTAITANCTGNNAQYTSKADCMTACAFIPVTDPLGMGNTLACRAGVAAMAATAADANCWHAGAETFGSCGDECDAF